MKKELTKIAQDLEQGTITENEARTLLLGLLGVSESNLYDVLANVNNLIETERPNVWIKNEQKGGDDSFETTYVLTKLGFRVRHEYKPPKTEVRFPFFNWLSYFR